MKKLFVALFAVTALCFTAAAEGHLTMNHANRDFHVLADGVYWMGASGTENMFSGYGFYVNDIANKIDFTGGASSAAVLKAGDTLSLWFELDGSTLLYGTDALQFYTGSMANGAGGQTVMSWASSNTGELTDAAYLNLGLNLADGVSGA